MAREAELTGVVRPEVDDRALDQAGSRMNTRLEKAAEITPDIVDGSKIRRKLKRAVPGGKIAGKLADRVGGSGGGPDDNLTGDLGSRGVDASLQEQQVELLGDIKDEIEKLGTSGTGGGGDGGGFLSGLGLGSSASAGLGKLALAGGISTIGAAAPIIGMEKAGEFARQSFGEHGSAAMKGFEQQSKAQRGFQGLSTAVGAQLGMAIGKNVGNAVDLPPLQAPEWLKNVNVQAPDYLQDLDLEAPGWLQDLDVQAPDYLQDISVEAPGWLQDINLKVPSVLKGGIDINVPDVLQQNQNSQQKRSRRTVSRSGDQTPTTRSDQPFLGLTDNPIERIRQRTNGSQNNRGNNTQTAPVQVEEVNVTPGDLGPAIEQGLQDLEQFVTKRIEKSIIDQTQSP